MPQAERRIAISGRCSFTELDLRRMLERASGYREDVVEGRWIIETRHRGRAWDAIVEPDRERQLLVVVTAYPVRE